MDPSTPATLAFDDFAIDFAGRRLLRGSTEQPLEPKAFGVLALLAGTPGRAFTRDEILDAVWGHRHVTPGVLNRAMTLLRHALGEDAQEPRYLRTVHGVGYRFDLPEPAPRVAAQEPEAETPHVARRGRVDDGLRPRWRVALWSLPLLAVLAFAGWTWWLRTAPAAAGARASAVMERSIAVLPLVNASRDPNQQFFSDGLSESLINALSRFDGLKVIGRDSAFQFRDSKDDSRAIGRKLGVSYLLGGSVQHVGDVVRINAALTKTADGSALWAEHYDRPYKDLFALQDEIAQDVADALQARLLPDSATKQNDRPPSGDMDAYAAYLHGMQFYYQGDSREMIRYLTLATRLDPAYAAAWAYLSVAWARLGTNDAGEQAQADYRQARIAADKALALAPDVGLTHAVQGNLLLSADFAWQGALAEFRRAIELAPEIGAIHSGYSRTLAANGKVREALVQKRLALSLDPRMIGERFRYVDLLMAAGRLDEAEKEAGAAVEVSGFTEAQTYYRLRFALLRGDAKAAMEAAAQASPDFRDFDLTLAVQTIQDRAAADAALAKFLRDHEDWGAQNPYDMASLYALRGDAGRTVEWLDRAREQRDTNLLYLLYDPLILRFRDDPRLIAFCEKIGLPPPSESTALGIDQIRASIDARGR